MRVVIDTNVLISATRSQRGASNYLLALIPDNRFQIALSFPLYLEYLDVLLRPKIRLPNLTENQIVGAVRYLTSHAHLQEIHFRWRPFLRDSKDDLILELAVASQAENIITFNLKDFDGIEVFGIKALTPGDFLSEIGEFR